MRKEKIKLEIQEHSMIPAFWPITVAKRISIFYSFVIKVDYAQMLLFLILGNDPIYISYIPLKSYLYDL